MGRAIIQNTKEQILSEARRVFERFGYTKTSMADIAIAARKGRRTLYTYFISKEEVFKAVIKIEVDAVIIQLRENLDSKLPPAEKLKAHMHLRMNAVRDLTLYYDAMRQELKENLGLIENVRVEYDEMEREMIEQILNEGVELNHFDITNTSMVAGAIVLATKGFELPLYMGQPDYSPTDLIDPLMQLFYRGILKH